MYDVGCFKACEWTQSPGFPTLAVWIDEYDDRYKRNKQTIRHVDDMIVIMITMIMLCVVKYCLKRFPTLVVGKREALERLFYMFCVI